VDVRGLLIARNSFFTNASELLPRNGRLRYTVYQRNGGNKSIDSRSKPTSSLLAEDARHYGVDVFLTRSLTRRDAGNAVNKLAFRAVNKVRKRKPKMDTKVRNGAGE